MSKTEWKNNHISGKGEDKNALDMREEMVKRIFLRDSGRAKCCVLQDKIRQNVSRKMDGEACPADGGGTRSFRVGATIFPVILWRVLQPQGLCQRH